MCSKHKIKHASYRTNERTNHQPTHQPNNQPTNPHHHHHYPTPSHQSNCIVLRLRVDALFCFCVCCTLVFAMWCAVSNKLARSAANISSNMHHTEPTNKPTNKLTNTPHHHNPPHTLQLALFCVFVLMRCCASVCCTCVCNVVSSVSKKLLEVQQTQAQTCIIQNQPTNTPHHHATPTLKLRRVASQSWCIVALLFAAHLCLQCVVC